MPLLALLLLVAGLLIAIADFLSEVESNYQRLRSCLRDNPNFRHPETAELWKYPENAAWHYETLLGITAKYRYARSALHSISRPHLGRTYPYHKLRTYYAGPWIENHFIDRFVDKPLHSFGGLIPLFVQWTDYNIHVEVRRM